VKKSTKTRILTLTLAAAALFTLFCTERETTLLPTEPATEDSTTDTSAIKYVFLFIGDGMGLAHIAAAEAHLAAQEGLIGSVSLSFTDFPVIGLVTTHSANSYITCSAASATAMATGVKVNNETLNIDPQGNTLRPITYDLKDAGYKIGIATTVTINHATPAAFYAVEADRRNYYHIALQIAPTGFHFFAGSGISHQTGANGDEPEENIYNQILSAGYAVIRTKEELAQTPMPQKILMAQDTGLRQNSLTPMTDRTGEADGWTLADFTKTGIALLDNPNGFFFMIEGGQIDWASHGNDTPMMVYEVIDLSQAVQAALEFYQNRPGETLIIVTADHETGGAALSANEDGPLVLWSSQDHTAEHVPIFAIGPGSELFSGKMDNTDIHNKIKTLMLGN